MVNFNDTILKEINNRLVDAYNPMAIYLFGSRVWGQSTTESDFDILVIIADSTKKPHRRLPRGYKALRGLKISKDLRVYTEEEFKQLSSDAGTLFHKIEQEGIVLYEAA